MWDGKERRNVEQWQSREILEELQNIKLSLRELKVSEDFWKEQVEHLIETVFGNGKPGIRSDLSNLSDRFQRHDNDDRWIHKTVILSVIAMLSFMVKIVFFK